MRLFPLCLMTALVLHAGVFLVQSGLPEKPKGKALILVENGGREVRRPHRNLRAPSEPTDGGGNSEGDNTLSQAELTGMGNEMPEYPQIAIDAGWEGTVVLNLLLDGDAVREATLVESSGHRVLDAAALTAARGWRIADRGPEVRVPIRFVIE